MRSSQLCRLRKTIAMQVNITSFLLLIGCLQLSATTLSQTVSLKAENLPLSQVFSEIETQTGYYIMYNSRFVKSAKPVTFSATRMPVAEFLDAILPTQSLKYTINENTILVSPATKAASPEKDVLNVHQQQREITGRVTGDEGQPLEGVTVAVKNTNAATTTDASGYYRIVLPSGGEALVFSIVGYGSQETEIGQSTVVNVALKESISDLNEVVVVGYGTQRREQVTSAIASVKSEDFVKGSVQDAAQLIRGKVAGLSIATPSGNPTSTSQVMLRGNVTINGNTAPLILIDGIPGSLMTVSPEDIESIDVLKDGSAAAIYGTRGTNGVILITTRKVNGEMPPTLDFNAYWTTQEMTRKLEFMNAEQYRQLVQQGKPGAVDFGGGTNWLQQASQHPFSQVYNLSLKGGNRNTNYIMSMEYRDLNGVMKRSDNTVIYPRLAINHTMFDGLLKLNANINGYQQTHFTSDGGNYSGLIYRNALTFNPTAPLKDENGNWVEQPDKTDYMNPVALINESSGENRNQNLRTFGTATLTPFDGLAVKALFSRDIYHSTRGFYETKQHYSTVRSGRNGFASRGTTRSKDDLFELTADYNTSVGDHHFTLLGGYTWRKYNTEDYWMQNWDFPSDDFTYNNIGAGLALRRGEALEGSVQTENKLAGYFFRLNYSLQDKYLLMASIRREGSSRFGANHKWGNFPAVSVGWNLQKEDFLQEVAELSALKLRAGYGVTGTEPNTSYMSLNKINFNTNVLVNGEWIQSINPSNNPNPDLRWETKEELNVGLDFALFDYRLSGAVDYYVRTTKDLIANFPVPTPPYLYSSITANAASMQNKGVEIQLNAVAVRTPSFEWTTSANFSTNANRVTALSNDRFALASGYFDTGNTGEPIQQATHRVQVGQPIGNFYGFKSVDIDDNGHWVIEGKDGNPKPIAQQQADDRQILGNGVPTRYLNWNNTFSYKDFDLNITMRGAFDFQILNMTEMFWSAPVMLTRGNLKTNAYDNIYGKRPLADDQSLQYVSYYLEDGDFWKIDNVTLGYNARLNIPHLKSARFYASVSNLYTFTSYKGMDPEVSIAGLAPGIDDKNRYPAVRTYTFGVFLGF